MYDSSTISGDACSDGTSRCYYDRTTIAYVLSTVSLRSSCVEVTSSVENELKLHTIVPLVRIKIIIIIIIVVCTHLPLTI